MKNIYIKKKYDNKEILLSDILAAGEEEREIRRAHPFLYMGWRAASLWASGVFASFPVCSGLESERTKQHAQEQDRTGAKEK